MKGNINLEVIDIVKAVALYALGALMVFTGFLLKLTLPRDLPLKYPWPGIAIILGLCILAGETVTLVLR